MALGRLEVVRVEIRHLRRGDLGELGVSERIYPNEEKMLKAGAIAQSKTGLGVHVHTLDYPVDGNRFPFGLDILDIFEKNGADISKVCLDHMGVRADVDMDYCTEILKRGAYIEFETFGHEFYKDNSGRFRKEMDRERIHAISKLCAKGFEKQILISTDVACKTLLRKYGGCGYAHILTSVIPMMRNEGYDNQLIEQITIKNPADFLDSDMI